MHQLFAMRGKLDARTRTMVEVFGGLVVVFLWWLVVAIHLVNPKILPSPISVLTSIPELWSQDHFLSNFLFSLKVNMLALLEAVVIALPIGFIIGLVPLFDALTARLLSASRYLPVTALIGLFISLFGIFVNMKVQFLTLGIVVYLIPAWVIRVAEVKQVYIDTINTLGASYWQTYQHVIFPDVMSRISDDILNLTALSWTYIVVVENINRTDGGIGPLFFLAGRAGRVDKVYAGLIAILLFGFVWDKVWKFCDQRLFPFKYE